VGVSIDTIRKIESGRVIPRYDTLELLSFAYKEDLLDLLKNSRSNKFLMEYHDEVDYIISCYEKGAAPQLRDKLVTNFSDDASLSMVNPREFEQFLTFVDSIDPYHSEASVNYRFLRDKLVDALCLTIPNYRIRRFRQYKYSYIEFRILLLISLLIAREENFAFSNDILYFILDKISDKNYTTKYVDYLIITVYSNIAYNFHRLDNHAKALEVADVGIAFCREKRTNHVLFTLYYRKGMAQFFLGDENHLDSITTAFYLLKAMGIPTLLEKYKKITEDTYGITVPLP
jgi:transcriptional regulator with XRE-family HTH domain